MRRGGITQLAAVRRRHTPRAIEPAMQMPRSVRTPGVRARPPVALSTIPWTGFRNVGPLAHTMQETLRDDGCRGGVRRIAGIPVEVYPAANMADLYAAAAVRTVSFTVYNKDRSEFSKQSHRKMTMASERNALQRKMNGEEPGYDKVKVTVLLATTPVPEDEAVAAMLQGEIDPSCKLPAKDDQPPLMCLGSLDLNQCETFPSEDLMPLDQSSNGAGRAFLSNVCTTSGGRRSGIASKVRAIGFGGLRSHTRSL